MKRCMHAFLAVIIGLVGSGCEEKKAREALESAKNAASDAAGEAADLFAQGKDAVLKKFREEASGLEPTIADLKAKGANLTGEAKSKFEAGLKDIEAKRVELAKKLEPFSSVQGEGWKELGRDIQKALADLKRAVADLKSQLTR